MYRRVTTSLWDLELTLFAPDCTAIAEILGKNYIWVNVARISSNYQLISFLTESFFFFHWRLASNVQKTLYRTIFPPISFSYFAVHDGPL